MPTPSASLTEKIHPWKDIEDPGILSRGPWESASFRLPRSASIPVEVRMRRTKNELRATAGGDWRDVLAWRSVTLTKALLNRLRREQKTADTEPNEAEKDEG